MKVIIFGLGSIGKRHAQILKERFKHELFAFRSNDRAEPNVLGLQEIFDWAEIEKNRPDIAFITNLTSLHVETAVRCAAMGMHLFIEKPLSDNMQGIAQLESLCREKKLTCYTAYGLRFHPVIKKLREFLAGKRPYHVRVVCSSYLPDWRKDREVKDSYSSQKEQGGGVLLDLSHEFDYIQYLFGQIAEMKGAFGRASDLTVNAEDHADILLTLAGGRSVNLHLNFMSQLQERSIKIDLQDGYAIGDLINNKIILFKDKRKEELQFAGSRNDYLAEQTSYFFDNLGNPSIMNNLQESSALLKKILEFKNG
jgi:predicted dehydrogenase